MLAHAGARKILVGGRVVHGYRWMWPLLGFFTVWIGGTSLMSANLVAQGLAAGAEPKEALVPILFSFFFLFAVCSASYLVVFTARAHREELELGFEPELDHDELRLRWRPARPSVLRLLWTLALLAVPLVIGVALVPSVVATFVPSALGLSYLGSLVALWLFGLAATARTAARELSAFDRYRLDVRGGEMALTVEGLVRSGRSVWSLGAARVRSGYASLVVEDASGVRRIPYPTAAGNLDQLAAWLQSGEGTGASLPPPPPALASLRGRAPLKGRRR